METFSEQDTIAALATPAGEGGVAIVRISGILAPDILNKLFKIAESFRGDPAGRSHQENIPIKWKSHHLYYGRLIGLQSELLDESLAVWMKAPNSFTGEEVVEFHLHGGKLISLKVLQTIYKLGARPANPGEFSQRAFLNGKIDLTQAEAIADMIAAKSERSLSLAQAQWQGKFSGPVQELRKILIELLVNLEAAVDFPEEEIEIIHFEATKQLIEKSVSQIQQWLIDYELGKILREGLTIALIGKPNVGKSSLLNLLVKEDAAIVHDEPGTTRDAIERQISLNGLSVRFVDTAGMRETEGVVEQKGIERSRQWFEKADLALVLLDVSSPLEKEDFEVLELAKNKKSILILNKVDLPAVWTSSTAPLLWKERGDPIFISLSTKTSEGLKNLESAIFSQFGIQDLEKEDHLLLNQLRHKQALEKALSSLTAALQALENHYSPEFVAADIQSSIRYLGEIIGEVSTEEVLGEIFGRFCIGK